MPAKSFASQHLIRVGGASPVTAARQSNTPVFSGTNSAGALIELPEAGHITRLSTTGQDFQNLPSGGNAFMPSRGGVNRMDLYEYFLQRPALNPVIGLPGSDSTSPTAAALAAYTVANKNFEILGSSAVTADVTFAAGGGIVLPTHGGANTTDAIVLLPHLDTNQTLWTAAPFKTDNCPTFETVVNIAAAGVGSGKVYAGFKQTRTDVLATDDNQAYFVFDTANTAGTTNGATQWVCVNSNASSGAVIDNVTDSGITVLAATNYHLMIQLDINRIPYFYINGMLVGIGNGTPASGGGVTSLGRMTTATTLIPYIGAIQKTNSIVVAPTVRCIHCGQNYTD